MRFKFHVSQLPPLCSAALGILLSLLVVGGFAWQQATHSNQVWAQMYGESLAAMTAKSAIDSTLNHDLVSLQVVLQDVVQSPKVVFATLHDVENNLLVQAGAAPSAHQMHTVESYSAAIGFQESVAGYVSVHIDKTKPQEALWWAYWGAVALALIVAFLALLDASARVFERQEQPPVNTAHMNDEQSTGITHATLEADRLSEVLASKASGLRASSSNESTSNALPLQAPNTDESVNTQAFAVTATAQIVLQITDFTKLKKTLSADRVNELNAQWLALAQTALDLYGGQWASAPSNSMADGALIALFPSAQSAEDAMKTAAFFGAVVKSAFKPPLLKVKVDAIVGLQDEFMHLSARPASSFAVYFSTDAHRLALSQRIRFSALDGAWWQLDSFNMGYQALLDKQVAQLCDCVVTV